MRVGINARALTKPDPAGVSRYTGQLLVALAETRPGHEYVLFGVDRVPDPLDGYGCVHSARVPAPTHSGARAHAWEQARLPWAINRADLDVFHTPAGQPPLCAPVPLVTTIHDISPIRRPEWFSTAYATALRVLTPLAVRRSERIIGVSEFARDELVAAYPSAEGKAVAVYNGVGPPATAGEPVDGLRDREFILFVGSASPRKNLTTLFDAYDLFRARVEEPPALALAGPDRRIFAEIDPRRTDGAIPLGYVSDAELTWLYRRATAFVYPSLYEGFGLPIVEAMRAGTLVITSGRGAMAEIAADAAYLVDPTDPSAVATGLEQVVDDDELRDRLESRGRERAGEFTWPRAARETERVYRAAAG